MSVNCENVLKVNLDRFELGPRWIDLSAVNSSLRGCLYEPGYSGLFKQPL